MSNSCHTAAFSSALCFLSACSSGLLPADAPAPTAQVRPTAQHRAIETAPLVLRGSMRVSPALAATAHSSETVYVLAREAASPRIFAVLRLFVPKESKEWPLMFALEDERLKADLPLSVSVRIDEGDDATTKTKGDLVGAFPGQCQLAS